MIGLNAQVKLEKKSRGRGGGLLPVGAGSGEADRSAVDSFGKRMLRPRPSSISALVAVSRSGWRSSSPMPLGPVRGEAAEARPVHPR